MALTSQSLFLYDFHVTVDNASIDFKKSSGGSVIMATLSNGFYSLTGLMVEIERAMNAADSTNTYTVTADRTYELGKQNRVTISTSGIFLSLLFGSGPRSASTTAPLIGFTSTDKTGSTRYTGTFSAGTSLITELTGYNFLAPEFEHQIYGNVNVSAFGVKEAVVFQIMKFFEVEFKYEPRAKVVTQWEPLMDWLIQQRLFEFTPEITNPTIFYEGTLEKTSKDGKGLGYKFTEMLPNYPQNFQTGALTFRVNQT